MKHESKTEQYAGYLRNGGSMSLQEWEADGRYDCGLAGPIFTFESDIPSHCYTRDQARAVMMCRMQKELDAFLEGVVINERETAKE